MSSICSACVKGAEFCQNNSRLQLSCFLGKDGGEETSAYVLNIEGKVSPATPLKSTPLMCAVGWAFSQEPKSLVIGGTDTRATLKDNQMSFLR